MSAQVITLSPAMWRVVSLIGKVVKRPKVGQRLPVASVRPFYTMSALTSQPGWKRRMLSRPMRKVVSMHTILRRGASKHEHYTLLVLELDCGHEVEELAMLMGDHLPRRRRCKECAA